MFTLPFPLLFFPLYKKPHPSDKVTLSNYSLYIPKTGNPTQNSQNVSNGNKNRVYSKKSIMRKSGAGWRYEVILFSCLGRREGYELFLLDYAFSFSSFSKRELGFWQGVHMYRRRRRHKFFTQHRQLEYLMHLFLDAICGFYGAVAAELCKF